MFTKGIRPGVFWIYKRAFISTWKAIFDINLGDSTLSDCRGPQVLDGVSPDSIFYFLEILSNSKRRPKKKSFLQEIFGAYSKLIALYIISETTMTISYIFTPLI